jgi:ATP-dependent RNA helicase RhlE
LERFRNDEIRLLVASDVAARGLDIEFMSHVFNFDVPIHAEDYVHRIGRTGRAGKEGQAVSLVCLDEEGFMQEIERFTKQDIPTVVVEGFGPEPGEEAQPIAMGRQVLWGGKGRPPAREVMNAAAKAARSEMMQRIRENKDKSGGSGKRKPEGEARNGNGNSNGQQARNGGNGQQPRNGNGQQARNGNGQQARNGNGNGNGQQPRNGNGNGGSRPPRTNRPAQPPQQARAPQQPRDDDGRERAYDDDSEDRMPRNIDPLRTNMPGRRDMTGVKRVNANGQPDPTRTSIDTMGATGRRHNGGGGGGNRRGGNPTRNYGR